MTTQERPGPTGRRTQPPIDPGDQGEIRAAMYLVRGSIIMDFGTTLSWLAMTPAEARTYAAALIQFAHKAEGRTADRTSD